MVKEQQTISLESLIGERLALNPPERLSAIAEAGISRISVAGENHQWTILFFGFALANGMFGRQKIKAYRVVFYSDTGAEHHRGESTAIDLHHFRGVVRPLPFETFMAERRRRRCYGEATSGCNTIELDGIRLEQAENAIEHLNRCALVSLIGSQCSSRFTGFDSIDELSGAALQMIEVVPTKTFRTGGVIPQYKT